MDHCGTVNSSSSAPITRVEFLINENSGWLVIALHCIALHCIALHCIALHCIALHCIVLHCIALYCIVLYCILCNILSEVSRP